MSWSRSAICFVCSALACGSAPGCRARPSAPVAGETLKLRGGERAPERTAAWDGATIRLRGVRGETLSLQVIAPHARARLELPVGAANVAAFTVGSLEVREPSTAMYGPSRGAGRYPDVLTPSPGAEVAGPAFFDVAIPKGARPGRYFGALSLSSEGGATTLPVELTIEPITIDLARDPLVWVFYLPRELAREHGVADDDGPAELTWERRYVELFRAHGCFLASDLGPRHFAARREFSAGLRFWPVAFDLSTDERLAADVREWLSLFGAGLTVPFSVAVDEPRSAADRARVRHVGEVVARAGGGAPRLLRAVTAGPSPDYDAAVDVYLTPKVFGAAPPPDGKRRWTYNGRPPEAGSVILDTDGAALRTWGWIAFRYGVELWYAWEGLYFSDRYNGGGPTHVLTDPDTFDERRKRGTDHGNGDGVLAYPGPRPSLRLKALRRGLEDRLLLERLVACGGGEEARRQALALVPRALGEGAGEKSWPTDETAWEAARGRVLDALVAQCRE